MGGPIGDWRLWRRGFVACAGGDALSFLSIFPLSLSLAHMRNPRKGRSGLRNYCVTNDHNSTPPATRLWLALYSCSAGIAPLLPSPPLSTDRPPSSYRHLSSLISGSRWGAKMQCATGAREDAVGWQ